MTALNPPNSQSEQAIRAGSQAPSPARVADANWACVTPMLIARRAYQIWERNGRPEAQSDQFWSLAEEELRRS